MAECTINLTETENLLQACEDDLAQCQAAEGQAFPATGQTTCWDSIGMEIPCAGTGHDGDIRAGAPLDYTVTDLTMIDNNTSLEWMKQDENDSLGTGDIIFCDPGSYPGNLDMNCSFTWDDAFRFITTLNANNHAGGGWRMPNVKELQSIVNYENANPAVSVEFNTGCVAGCTLQTCSCTAATCYWSSTSTAEAPFLAWQVSFATGGIRADSKLSTDVCPVRAVRGPVIDH